VKPLPTHFWWTSAEKNATDEPANEDCEIADNKKWTIHRCLAPKLSGARLARTLGGVVRLACERG
jgi:hypothetical protein